LLQARLVVERNYEIPSQMLKEKLVGKGRAERIEEYSVSPYNMNRQDFLTGEQSLSLSHKEL
jgi:hypothetical protein